MSTVTFTPGSKVRCVRGSSGIINKGDVYTVGAYFGTQIYISGELDHKLEKPLVVVYQRDRRSADYPYLWDADRFVPVSDDAEIEVQDENEDD